MPRGHRAPQEADVAGQQTALGWWGPRGLPDEMAPQQGFAGPLFLLSPGE